ncbi:hypothetical protein E4U30_000759, partial [Claviceps sp. LM220 group G6]
AKLAATHFMSETASATEPTLLNLGYCSMQVAINLKMLMAHGMGWGIGEDELL